MTAPLNEVLKGYSIRLIAWDEWQIWLHASSAEDAEAEALRILSEEGDSDFKHRGCGIDHVEVEEVLS